MIRHIVMWRVCGATAQENERSRRQVKEAFEGLRGLVAGLERMEIGCDQSNVDYACDLVMTADFIDSHALTAYANHPEHLRVRNELQGIRVERYQVDYALPSD